MNRRHGLSLFLPALTLAAAVTLQAAPARPNILPILTEDQGAHMGALGTPGLRTPHMGALAASGRLFRNAFVACTVCSVSKAAIYTGLHSHRNGILNNTVIRSAKRSRRRARRAEARAERDRLYAALCQWVRATADPAVQPPPATPRESP